jgi:hypothetical protein
VPVVRLADRLHALVAHMPKMLWRWVRKQKERIAG